MQAAKQLYTSQSYVAMTALSLVSVADVQYLALELGIMILIVQFADIFSVMVPLSSQ